MTKLKPVPPMGVSINDSMFKRVVRWFFTALGVLCFAVLIAVLLMEWMVGCGESYVDSKGGTHLNECLFINRGKNK